MNWDKATRDILMFAALGALFGAAVGLMFWATSSSINPFTPIALGLFLGSMLSLSRQKRWVDSPD